MTMDIEDVADEIRCVYPHITRGYLKEEQALILRGLIFCESSTVYRSTCDQQICI